MVCMVVWEETDTTEQEEERVIMVAVRVKGVAMDLVEAMDRTDRTAVLGTTARMDNVHRTFSFVWSRAPLLQILEFLAIVSMGLCLCLLLPTILRSICSKVQLTSRKCIFSCWMLVEAMEEAVEMEVAVVTVEKEATEVAEVAEPMDAMAMHIEGQQTVVEVAMAVLVVEAVMQVGAVMEVTLEQVDRAAMFVSSRAIRHYSCSLRSMHVMGPLDSPVRPELPV